MADIFLGDRISFGNKNVFIKVPNLEKKIMSDPQRKTSIS